MRVDAVLAEQDAEPLDLVGELSALADDLLHLLTDRVQAVEPLARQSRWLTHSDMRGRLEGLARQAPASQGTLAEGAR